MLVEKFQERNCLQIINIQRLESNRVWMGEGIKVLHTLGIHHAEKFHTLHVIIIPAVGQTVNRFFGIPYWFIGHDRTTSISQTSLLAPFESPWGTIWKQFEHPGPSLDLIVPALGCLVRKWFHSNPSRKKGAPALG